MIDFSSTTHPIYLEYLTMAEKLVSQLHIGAGYTFVAMVVFSNVGSTHTIFSLKQYQSQEAVVVAIKSAEYMGGTTAIGVCEIEVK